jgi:hypothetical protein
MLIIEANAADADAALVASLVAVDKIDLTIDFIIKPLFL